MTTKRAGARRRPRIAIATNNGDIGGGEVMLLAIAEAMRALGMEVVVLGPRTPGDLVAEAARRGFEVTTVPASSRPAYMVHLALWRARHPRTPLWCNGLVPSLATAPFGHRIVHLHSRPAGRGQRAAAALARVRAAATLVPSHAVARKVPGSRVLENWTAPIDSSRMVPLAERPTRVGYLGRLTASKGITDLCAALAELNARGRGLTLVVGGASRHARAGDDAELSRALERLGTSAEFLGWVSPADFFPQIDILVVPSRAFETFGLVVAEALGYGVPVVVSNAGALAEVAGPDHPWVFPAGDAEALVAVLDEALDTWGARAPRVREQGRDRWAAMYSPQAGLSRMQTMLTTLAPAASSERTARDR